MRWRLFLDDVRYPPSSTIGDYDWRLARNFDDAFWMLRTYGMPQAMSLDHDLGLNSLTGMDFLKTVVAYLIENPDQLAADFTLEVHSANPVGAENMRSYWQCYLDNEAPPRIGR